MIIGSHVQMKAPLYFEGAVQEMLLYKANALMLYTGAPQNSRRTAVEKMKIAEGRKLMEENHIPFDRVIVHAPYIINTANSVKPEVAELAVSFLHQEIERTAAMGAKYIVLHPGSYTTTNLETGIQTVISQLNKVHVPDTITICLETMAGKGTEVGFRFEDLATILSKLEQSDRYGICMDTCHISDAGYDLADFDAILDEFDRIIGLDKLHVIHLNDSKNIRGARKDRHENIGLGTIGFDTLRAVATNTRVENVPKILETPFINGFAPYGIEIDMLKSGCFDASRLSIE